MRQHPRPSAPAIADVLARRIDDDSAAPANVVVDAEPVVRGTTVPPR